MLLPLALTTSEIQTFFFDWYPVFGVFFMFALLLVFVTLLRGTLGSDQAGDGEGEQDQARALGGRAGG